MLKKILIPLGIFIVLLIAIGSIFLNWAKNPYGLEPERVGPKGNEDLPKILLIPNAKNYLLYPGYDNNSYVFHLPLPNEYIHPSNTTTRISKSYAVAATMYYPELNGKFHPDNMALPKCNGWCGGYLRAFIKPNKSDVQTINARAFKRIENDRSKNSPLHKFEDLGNEFGLGEHFQIRYPVIEKKSNGEKHSTKEYFVKRDQDGTIQYLFECRPYAPSPGCGVKFNLSSTPELLVDIKFGRHLMTNWENIISATNKKISSWEITRVETVVN